MKQFQFPTAPQKYDPETFNQLIRAIELALLKTSVPDPGTITGAMLVANPTLGASPAFTAGTVAFWTGTGAPSNSFGSNGDFYFRSDGAVTACIYQMRSAAWVATAA